MNKAIKAADVVCTPVEYLWRPYLARGKVTPFGGEGGTGKTTLLAAIAAAVSSGVQPDEMPGELLSSGSVLYIGDEDGNSDMRWKLESVNADLSKVYLYDDELTLEGDNLKQLLISYSPALVIIDPLLVYEPDYIDPYKARDARKSIRFLREHATEFNCSIVPVIHPPKSNEYKLVHRFMGSGGYIHAPRSAFYVGYYPNPDKPTKRVMINVKNNLEPADPVIFEIDPVAGFGWCGSDSTITTTDIENAGMNHVTKSDGELKRALAVIQIVLHQCSEKDGMVIGTSGKLIELYEEATGHNSPISPRRLGRLLSNRPMKEFLEKNNIDLVNARVKDGHKLYAIKEGE